MSGVAANIAPIDLKERRNLVDALRELAEVPWVREHFMMRYHPDGGVQAIIAVELPPKSLAALGKGELQEILGNLELDTEGCPRCAGLSEKGLPEKLGSIPGNVYTESLIDHLVDALFLALPSCHASPTETDAPL